MPSVYNYQLKSENTCILQQVLSLLVYTHHCTLCPHYSMTTLIFSFAAHNTDISVSCSPIFVVTPLITQLSAYLSRCHLNDNVSCHNSLLVKVMIQTMFMFSYLILTHRQLNQPLKITHVFLENFSLKPTLLLFCTSSLIDIKFVDRIDIRYI